MIPIPKISQYMTPAPKTISVEQSLEEASDYMRRLHVRHLPVTRGGRPVGILTDRDLSLAMSFANLEVRHMKVGSLLTPNPFLTSPNEPINKVVEHMTEAKYGCVLVMEEGSLVGIFTTIDALRALADVFRNETN